MFVIDDLLLRPFVSILDAVHTLAMTELYDIEAIQNDLKENQLLYELGERSEGEYRERKRELEAELETAEIAHDQLRDKTIEVQ